MAFLEKEGQWRALTIKFVTGEDPIIFIIDDYEAFYRNPLANGTFKTVDKPTMQRNWVDREDLMFVWDRKQYINGDIVEQPVIGSQQEATRDLLEHIEFLRTYVDGGYSWSSSSSSRSSSSSSSCSSSSCSGSGVSSSMSSSSAWDEDTAYMTAHRTWRAVTVDYTAGNPIVAIYIINDYEDFYRDPLSNGEFKYVDKPTMEKGYVDREDLVFMWERIEYINGDIVERPVVGSHKEATGALYDIIQTLKAYA